MLQHVSATAGPVGAAAVRPAGRGAALAKKPEERFPSCLAFVQALMAGPATTGAAGGHRRWRCGGPASSGRADDEPRRIGRAGRAERPPTPTGRRTAAAAADPELHPARRTGRHHPGRPTAALPDRCPPADRRPGRAPGHRRRSRRPAPISRPPPSRREGPRNEATPSSAQAADPLGRAVGRLHRRRSRRASRAAAPDDFAAAPWSCAAGGRRTCRSMPGDIGRLADGAWVCQFPSTVPAPVVPLEAGGRPRDVGRGDRAAGPDAGSCSAGPSGGGGFFGGKKYGLEVIVLLPPAGQVGRRDHRHRRRCSAPRTAKFAREART